MPNVPLPRDFEDLDACEADKEREEDAVASVVVVRGLPVFGFALGFVLSFVLGFAQGFALGFVLGFAPFFAFCVAVGAREEDSWLARPPGVAVPSDSESLSSSPSSSSSEMTMASCDG